jgi:Tol biopolymer transport system component
MRRSFGIITFLYLVLINFPIAAQEQAPIAASKADEGVIYFLRNYNLWVHDLKSSQDRQITRDKKISTYTVSHSGNQIAYALDDGQLYILDLIYNKETLLLKKTSLADPSFSPKDDQLVFSCSVPDDPYFLSNTFGFVHHIWLFDIRTKKAIDLTDSRYHHINAKWSPDGKWLSYSAMVDPWWTMFRDVPWEIYLMNVNDKKDLAIKIGKGSQSQWVGNNTLTIAREKSIGVYNVQARELEKEFKADDGFDDFTIGISIDTIFYARRPSGEGVTKIIRYDTTSQKKREVIINADTPVYVKTTQ